MNINGENTVTHLTQPGPVSEGDFSDGTDIMLWNPNLSPARWRRATLRALVPGSTVLYGLSGLIAVAMGLGPATGIAAVLLVAFGAIATCIGACDAIVNVACFATDHRHRHGGPCRLEQRPSEFFYRTRDFTSLGTIAGEQAAQLISAVGELHTTPARSWLEPGLPGEAHRVVWEALCCLDRTRSVRALAAQLAAEPGEDALAGAAAAAVVQIDQATGELVLHLHGCLTLTRAWEAKLRHHDLAGRTDAALATLRQIPINRTVAAMEPLLQSAHAYLTAARDLADAGPFLWENPAAAAMPSDQRS
jgi:hypothetical protein